MTEAEVKALLNAGGDNWFPPRLSLPGTQARAEEIWESARLYPKAEIVRATLLEAGFQIPEEARNLAESD